MNVAVVGGGASGMIASICAYDAGANVTVFEHMPRLGRKLLLTGSGKCNISNTDMDVRRFHCADENNANAEKTGKDVIAKVLERCPQEETLAFFEKLGVHVKDRKGYLYPYCEQASSVVDALRFAVRDRDIDVHIESDIRRIEKLKQSNDRINEDKFIIETATHKLTFDRVILCCGSNVNRNTGSDGSGYEFAKRLGHTLVKPLPALTHLICEEDFYPSVAGIRTPAAISLYLRVNDSNANIHNSAYTLLGTETGELQLTKTGISGVCVFNLSFMAIRALDEGRRVKAVIDLLPDIDESNINEYMRKRIANLSNRPLEELFIGLLAKPLGILICKRCVLDLKRKCSDLDTHEIDNLCRMVKEFETFIKGSGDVDNAQVAQGGVKLSEIRENLESKAVSGLYFAGEILDVNGDCGGYNLQWAASSGMLAGREAAK